MAVLAGRARRALVGAVTAALAATALAAGGADASGAAPAAPTAPAQSVWDYGVSVYPDAGLVDGQEVELTLTGHPGETAYVMQCRAGLGDDAPLDVLSRNCGNGIDLVPPEYPAVTPFTVRTSFPDFAPDSEGVVTCGVTPNDCVIGVGGAGAVGWDTAPIDMTPPVVSVSPDRHLAPGSTVDVRVAGDPGAAVTVAQCVRPVGATLAAGQCGPGVAGTVGPDGSVVVPLVVAPDVPAVVTADEPTACRATNCAVAAFAADGTRLGEWRIGLQAVPVTVSLDRTTGLLDGDRVLVEATGLEPGGEYTLLRCDDVASDAPACEFPPPGATIVASPAGRLSASATVAQRFSDLEGDHVCRDECGVAVVAAAWPVPLAIAGYELATGALAASPATGLADGQAVTLTGTDLMASYEGPAFWVVPATGQWVAAQCAAAVLDDVTLLGVFRHCAAVPGAGPVDVPVSDATLTGPAGAALTTVLGEEVDCTASAGACVLALLRLEQDGTTTVVATPIAFA